MYICMYYVLYIAINISTITVDKYSGLFNHQRRQTELQHPLSKAWRTAGWVGGWARLGAGGAATLILFLLLGKRENIPGFNSGSVAHSSSTVCFLESSSFWSRTWGAGLGSVMTSVAAKEGVSCCSTILREDDSSCVSTTYIEGKSWRKRGKCAHIASSGSAKWNLLAQRNDGWPDRQTRASPPPHRWIGNSDSLHQCRGSPEWQLLVVTTQEKPEQMYLNTTADQCHSPGRYQRLNGPQPGDDQEIWGCFGHGQSSRYQSLTDVCSSLHLLPSVGEPVVHLQRSHAFKLRQFATWEVMHRAEQRISVFLRGPFVSIRIRQNVTQWTFKTHFKF